MNTFLDRTGKAVPIVLTAIGGILFLYYLGDRDLWPTDEDEYAQISREMLRSGNWLIPTCNGLPWTIKPVLLNWMISAISLPWGDVTEFRARLPSALGAIGSVLLTYALGRQMFSTRAGILAALVLGTNVLYIQQGRWAQTYMLSAFFSTLAIACFYWGYTTPARRTVAYLLMAAAAGLGVLTMGPVNLAMPGLVCLAFLVFNRDLWHIKEMRLVRGLLLFLAIAAPWYVMMAQQEDYGFDLLIKTNFVRYVDAWTHAQPFYYYLRDLVWTFAPWSFFLPGALILAISQRSGEQRQGILLALVWLFSLLLFFSIASGKRPQYLLGAYPAMALLVGYLFDRALHFWPESFYRKAIVIPSVILIVLFALLAVGAPIAALVSAPEHLVPALGFSLIAAVFSVLAYRAWRGDRPDRLMVLPVGLVLVLVVYGVHAIIPAVEPYKSIRPYAEYVRDQLDLEPNTAWGMYRTYRARYIYYADRFTSDLREEDELQAFLAQPNRALVILRHRDYEALKTTVLADTEVIDKRQIGSRTRNFVLVSNRPSRAITTPDQPAVQGRR